MAVQIINQIFYVVDTYAEIDITWGQNVLIKVLADNTYYGVYNGVITQTQLNISQTNSQSIVNALIFG